MPSRKIFAVHIFKCILVFQLKHLIANKQNRVHQSFGADTSCVVAATTPPCGRKLLFFLSSLFSSGLLVGQRRLIYLASSHPAQRALLLWFLLSFGISSNVVVSRFFGQKERCLRMLCWRVLASLVWVFSVLCCQRFHAEKGVC